MLIALVDFKPTVRNTVPPRSNSVQIKKGVPLWSCIHVGQQRAANVVTFKCLAVNLTAANDKRLLCTRRRRRIQCLLGRVHYLRTWCRILYVLRVTTIFVSGEAVRNFSGMDS